MSQKRFLIVGLGNPGKRYENTRHNLGFMVINYLARRFNLTFKEHELYEIARFFLNDNELIFLKPLTFMNNSGIAVAEVYSANQIVLSNMMVIVDDIALPFGKIRLRAKGSSGGHKGLQSVIETIGTEGFPRLRIGIKPEEEISDVVDFVLSDFSQEEKRHLDEIIDQASEGVICFVENGITKAMNKFN